MALYHEITGGSAEVKKFVRESSDSPETVDYIIREDKTTHEQKLVFADHDMYLTGPANYTKQGNPTIVDNVVSGLTDNDYVVTTNTSYIDVGAVSSFEAVVKFNSGLVGTGVEQDKFMLRTTNLANRLQMWLYRGSGSVQVYFPEGGSFKFFGSYLQLASNTTYWLKLIYDASTLKVGLYYSTDGTTYTFDREITLSSAPVATVEHVLFGRDAVTDDPNFSIDLNDTYIKVDGNLWFYGKNYATANIAPIAAGYHTNTAPIGCVATGAPTIVDGVMSGLSDSNYVLTNNVNTVDFSAIDEMELCIKSNVGQIGASNVIEKYLMRTSNLGNRWQIYIWQNDPKLYIRFPNNVAGGGIWLTSQTSLVANTTYWFKLVYTKNTKLSLYISTDGTNFTLDNETAIDFVPNAYAGAHRFGDTLRATDSNYSIDLNSTYIKINNEMWFDGKGQYPFTGYIDMRTQAFTAAPAGTVLLKNN